MCVGGGGEGVVLDVERLGLRRRGSKQEEEKKRRREEEKKRRREEEKKRRREEEKKRNPPDITKLNPLETLNLYEKVASVVGNQSGEKRNLAPDSRETLRVANVSTRELGLDVR